MLANTDNLNAETLQILPLVKPDDTELIKELYDRKVDIQQIITAYHCLDDYYAGKDSMERRVIP